MSRIGYIRVSSLTQNTERQLDGVQLDQVFTDKLSGKDMNRPALAEALVALQTGDVLVVHSMDRLARNAEDLLRTVRELNGRGIAIEFVKNNLKFAGQSDPMAQLMLTLLGAFSEFERSLIRERQREGIAIAKAKGKYRGHQRELTDAQAKELRAMVAKGEEKSVIAKRLGIARQTVYNYLPVDAVLSKNEPYSHEQCVEALQLKRSGMSAAEIATRLNVNRAKAYRMITRARHQTECINGYASG